MLSFFVVMALPAADAHLSDAHFVRTTSIDHIGRNTKHNDRAGDGCDRDHDDLLHNASNTRAARLPHCRSQPERGRLQ
jgi:hypothetical protein